MGAEGLSQAARPSGLGWEAAVALSVTLLATNFTWSGGAAGAFPKEMLLFVKAEMQ